LIDDYADPAPTDLLRSGEIARFYLLPAYFCRCDGRILRLGLLLNFGAVSFRRPPSTIKLKLAVENIIERLGV
jgi:hypothetical protein